MSRPPTFWPKYNFRAKATSDLFTRVGEISGVGLNACDITVLQPSLGALFPEDRLTNR